MTGGGEEESHARIPQVTISNFKTEDIFIFLFTKKENVNCFHVCKVYNLPATHEKGFFNFLNKR